VTFMEQDSQLLSGTVADNLRLARPDATARTLLESLRSALPGATIIAAIHDREFDHLPVPADASVRLAAGRVLRVT